MRTGIAESTIECSVVVVVPFNEWEMSEKMVDMMVFVYG